MRDFLLVFVFNLCLFMCDCVFFVFNLAYFCVIMFDFALFLCDCA